MFGRYREGLVTIWARQWSGLCGGSHDDADTELQLLHSPSSAAKAVKSEFHLPMYVIFFLNCKSIAIYTAESDKSKESVWLLIFCAKATMMNVIGL